MRLKSIRVKNFCRFYGEHTVKLDPGITFIVSENRDEPGTFESNGVGKTTLFHAIAYALFGETPQGLTGHDLINHRCGPKEFMQAELVWDDGTRVLRTYFPHRKRSEVILTTPSFERKGDPSVITKEIREYFHCTENLFRSALFMSQRDSTSTQFLAAKPAERSKILSDLVDDRVWQQAAKLMLVDIKELTGLYQASESKLAVHKRNLQLLQERLKQLTEALASANREEDEKRAKLKARFHQLKAEIAKETAIELDPPKADWPKLEEARIQISKKQQNLMEALKEIHSPPPPLGLGTTCPTCGEPARAERIEEVLAAREKANSERARLKVEISGTQKELEGVQQAQQRFRDWKARTDLAKDRRSRYNTELAHVTSELQNKPVSLFHLAEQEAVLKKQVSTQALEITELAKEAEEQGNKLAILKRLQLGFSSEMRNLLFDRIRGDLENYTEAYLHNFAGGQIRVEYPSGEGAREKFEIVVFNEAGVGQKLEAYSGGEFWRTTLAILLALRDVLMLKSGCTLPILLLDDPVGPVDPVGLTNLFSALGTLVEDNLAKTILVTVPDASVATTGNVVKIIREGGISWVA